MKPMTQYITVTADDRVEARNGVIKLHGSEGFEGMRRAGQLAGEILDAIVPHVVPGATTGELDDLIREHMLREGAIPATLGPQDAGAVVDDLGQAVGVECELLGVVVLENEDTVAGDPDRDHPVPVTADRVEDAARCCGTDRVFAGATSKEHHHRRPVHSASSRPGAHRRPS